MTYGRTSEEGKGGSSGRTRSSKLIELILGPDIPDITEKPSCCHVAPGTQIIFKSDLNFAVGFIGCTPFVQAGTAFGGIGNPKEGFTRLLDVDPKMKAGKFKYTVTLTDPKDPTKTYCDCDCPTIIVGELRGKEGSGDDR